MNQDKNQPSQDPNKQSKIGLIVIIIIGIIIILFVIAGNGNNSNDSNQLIKPSTGIKSESERLRELLSKWIVLNSSSENCSITLAEFRDLSNQYNNEFKEITGLIASRSHKAIYEIDLISKNEQQIELATTLLESHYSRCNN